ncbi:MULTISPECIES: hypothetical protein [Stenotrophomonas]|uniref:hypothetical protein n=1 Tax=Stenotrophomonas TaxID=40323 RepID=UPI00131F2952|nr:MULTISPECIES: hypothetical protein [Stenotrophomonas]
MRAQPRRCALLALACSAALLVTAHLASDADPTPIVRAALQRDDLLCLGLTQWPLDVVQEGPQARQAAALAALGLLLSEEMELDPLADGHRVMGIRYVPTDAATPYLHTRSIEQPTLMGTEARALQDICWGRKALDAVTEWTTTTPPFARGRAVYSYHLELAPWATHPRVLEAFPGIGHARSQASHPAILYLQQDSRGWRAVPE